MAVCEFVAACSFLSSPIATSLPRVMELTKRRLCHGEPSGCARNVVARALGHDHVPIDLTPSEMEKARAILARSGRTIH